MPVQVEIAHREPVKDFTQYIGTIRSRNSAVIQPQVEGHLTRILVRSGEHVRRGQQLMQIDPEKQQATVRTQEANSQSRTAQLELAKSELERKRQLAAAGVISKAELDQAQATYDASSADAKAVHSAVAEQREQLRYYSITAPVAGTVGDIPVQVGDRVSTSTVLTTVDSGGGLEIYVNIPEEKARDIRIGEPVEIEGNEGTANYRTRVSFISPRVDQQNQLLLIKAAIPQNPGSSQFRNEQTVHANVIWKESPQVVLPFYAVSRLSGQLFAFVAQKGDKGTVARQVRLEAKDMYGNQYVVTSGVKEGDEVIVSGVQMLVDGMPVQPMAAQNGPPDAQKRGDQKQQSEAK